MSPAGLESTSTAASQTAKQAAHTAVTVIAGNRGTPPGGILDRVRIAEPGHRRGGGNGNVIGPARPWTRTAPCPRPARPGHTPKG